MGGLKTKAFVWHTPCLRLNIPFLFVCGFGILLMSACSGRGAPASSGAHKDPIPKIVSMDASWAKYYPDMPSIKKDADLGVRGKITGIISTSAPANAPASTYFTLTVEEALWNPHTDALKPGSTIVIHQEGGMVNGVLYQADDDPLLQVGEETLLFLHQYSPGHFFILGGPSGRFKVNNGIVTPVSKDGMPLPAGTDLKSVRAQMQ